MSQFRAFALPQFRTFLMICVMLAANMSAQAPQSSPKPNVPETKFGHRHYEQAPDSSLAEAGPYRKTGRIVKMRAEAAQAFRAMVAAAAKDGVGLVPISGFRTVDYQQGLFQNAMRRYGSEQGAAKWVAPPGYSEHHTGYVLDLGDTAVPAADVNPKFEHTAAFRWLQQHAAQFNFEISFPKDNPQGVNYESWHWRWVGNDVARKTFHP